VRIDSRTSSRVLWVRRPPALGRVDAVSSDGYLAREPTVRKASHAGAGGTSRDYKRSVIPRRDLGFETVTTS